MVKIELLEEIRCKPCDRPLAYLNHPTTDLTVTHCPYCGTVTANVDCKVTESSGEELRIDNEALDAEEKARFGN